MKRVNGGTRVGAKRVTKLKKIGDPKHIKAVEIARRSFREYAKTYRALAK